VHNSVSAKENESVNNRVTLEILLTASMKNIAFWNVASFSLIELDRSFRGAECQGNIPGDEESMHL
jgi:hypothetical protein